MWCATVGMLLCLQAARADFVIGRPELLGAPFNSATVALDHCGGGLLLACGQFMTPDSFFTALIDDVRIYSPAVKP